ncbi:hypothetical protein A2331_04875 [Candidatus Falkowbacteria bacterium RIFOXYB2_FULL_34_18]|uniref:GDYXXLXY domain-containing protein n=1 Tax=Candidatus Falkowbacteria bacterium RIFOXYD2_FULL_34_120 TaxID=1798007 RepID=A0A1F5TNU9_9BACT|nr:MAG: hypothetical protein A2331_04875 [Candidatus Falkowbacteria bacterium RIFOXYB2_FULL_34_18]OGF28847.1 MAG: hypothetical protein A2500_00500 [Candidatus Falkowbacteria bacterium RIFOXYC12_FULL_34_55]OGF35780.1 MAG: hypothetical protein A2466_04570 [Candidatus Falkowbacteria bacterium RIFOXYC2_FULL_34_220]OGF38446.1 MAG: hypothetical protein A2515_02010 [Candidatus Falkowbacteria bacterium RIFOXYD12_FULL_34_57]OGF40498.1 MAG: hypothetical protein A2531_02915 [Candidatus Falkowbacteria bact
MNLGKKTKFILAVSIQILVILIIIIFKYSVLTGGSAVFLEIMPVDPRDPLRGDYVTFQYKISSINRYSFNYEPYNGDIIYIPLRQQGQYWNVIGGISKNKNDMNNKLFIKARVVSGGKLSGAKSFSSFSDDNWDTSIRVQYGIEEYFIPEGAGRNFNFWNKKAKAKVMIDDYGNAVFKQLYIDDEPWP